MKIDQAAYDLLTPEQKKLFRKDGDGYVMVGDTEIADEMRRARDREKAEADRAKAELAEANRKLAEIENGNARKSGDIKTIEKSWSDRYDALKKESDEKIAKLIKTVEKVLVDSEVTKIASEIFAKPARDARLIRDRIKVEFDGDEPRIRVLDKNGQPSAMTLAELKKETVDNDDYKDIIVASKASGSGGTGGTNGSGAPKLPKDYTEPERVKLARENPAEFQRLFPQKA